MKKALFVINTLGMGGAEQALINLFKQLEGIYDCSLYVMLGQGELIHRVPSFVHLLNPSFDDHSVLSKEGRIAIAKKILLSCCRHGALFKDFPYLCKNAFAMAKKKEGIQIDKLLWRFISDSAPYFTDEYDLAVSFIEGASAYYVAHHVKAKRKACLIHVDYEKAGYTKNLDGDTFLKFDRIFPVSEEVLSSFAHMYPQYAYKLQVFHNLIDQDEIKRKAKEGGGFRDSFTGWRILTIARLTKQKDLDVSIAAMKYLKMDGVKAKWYVLGEGDEREHLQRLINQNGLEKDFILLGVRQNPYPYIQECDIYVHATAFEGRSIAIQEALTLSKPVIVSDCPGNREQIIDGETGVMVNFQAESIAKGIELLLHDDELRTKLSTAASQIRFGKEDLPKLLELTGDAL